MQLDKVCLHKYSLFLRQPYYLFNVEHSLYHSIAVSLYDFTIAVIKLLSPSNYFYTNNL